MSWTKKKVQRWFRNLHRDIGYLAVGITLVYALSGFFLSHKQKNIRLIFQRNYKVMIL